VYRAAWVRGNKTLRAPIWSAEAISGFHTRRMTMLTRITLALALAFAVSYVVPASAGPRTCGHATMQYDSSGTWTGPYCD
jgi:hypothetical protein